MQYEELRELIRTNKVTYGLTEEEEKKRKLVREFRFFTGCPTDYLLDCSEDELMEMWAMFVVERVTEVM